MAMVLYQGPGAMQSFDEYTSTIKDTAISNQRRYAGLLNQGATCYLNSVIQTLFMTPEFRTAIFSWKYDESKDGPKETCIPLQLQKLFGYLQLSQRKSADTVGLTTSFGWTGRDVFQQQDAQELFRVLFDALEEAFKDTPLNNLIDQIYAGELIDYVRCIDVDYESERSDKFQDLSFAIIPFGKSKALSSLNECVKMYLRPEILDGENQYYAESVSKKVDAIKGIKLRRLPYIMTIQLKRFVYDFTGDNIVQKKINDVVKFPMILDMNQYISKKRRAQSLCAEDDDYPLTRDEFEEYLQEQIDILRRNSDNKKKTKESPNSSAYSSSLEMYNGDPVTSSDTNPSGNDDDDLDAFERLPDLVDSMGNKSPDQIMEEGHSKELEYYETHGTQSKEELLNLVASRGEWVYELYAVLIHSGAIAGGHYFAYIKDLSTSKWYNFNDSYVSEINERDVQEAWGKEITSTHFRHNSWDNSAGMYYNSYGSSFSNYGAASSTTTLSGSNAYMLMYRKVTKDPFVETGLPGITGDFPKDDVIPDYIRDAVRAENEEYDRKLREEEERKLQLSLSIYWKKELNNVLIKGTETLINLIERLWKRLNLLHEPEFEDILAAARQKFIEDSANNDETKYNPEESVVEFDEIEAPCPHDRIRLRHFIPMNGLKYDIYQLNSMNDTRTLENHCIMSSRQYTVEIRGRDDIWEEFIPGGLPLTLHIYLPDKNEYSDGYQFSVKQNSSLLDLKQKIALLFGKKYVPYSVDRMRIMKANRRFHLRPPTIDILDNNQLGLVDGYRIMYNDKLYVEEVALTLLEDVPIAPIESGPSITYDNSKSNSSTSVETLGYKALQATLFEMRLFHNIPFKAHPKYDNNLCSTCFTVDSRWTVSKLREVITEKLIHEKANLSLDSEIAVLNPYSSLGNRLSDFINLTPNLVRMFLQVMDGRELRQNVELSQENIYEGCKIVVSLGYVPPPDHVSLKFNIFVPKCHDGVTRREQYIHSLSTNSTLLLSNMSNDISKETESEGIHHQKASNVSADVINNSKDIDDVASPEHVNLSIQNEFAEKLHSYQLRNSGYEGNDSDESPWPYWNDDHSVIKVTKPKQSHAATKEGNNHTNTEGKSPATTDIALESEDIQPSNFAAVVIANDMDKAELIPIPVDYIFASESTLISTIREELANALGRILPTLLPVPYLESLDLQITSDEDGRTTVNLPPNRIRIRESSDASPGRILCDGLTCQQQRLYFASSRVVTIQILSESEALNEATLHPVDEFNDFLVVVMKWKRSSWSLSEKVEYILRGELSVQQLCSQLAAIYGISSINNMSMLLLKSYNKIHLSDLNQHTVRDIYRSWTCFSYEQRKLRDLSNIDFKLRNGDIILLQDVTEPLKVLTKEDLLSLQYVEEASRTIYGSTYGSSPAYSGGRYNQGYNATSSSSIHSSSVTSAVERIDEISTTSSTSKSKSKSSGIKIITQRDRQKLADTVSNLPANVKEDSPVTIEQETFGSESETSPVVNGDDSEFIKQGGISLFSDYVDD